MGIPIFPSEILVKQRVGHEPVDAGKPPVSQGELADLVGVLFLYHFAEERLVLSRVVPDNLAIPEFKADIFEQIPITIKGEIEPYFPLGPSPVGRGEDFKTRNVPPA